MGRFSPKISSLARWLLGAVAAVHVCPLSSAVSALVRSVHAADPNSLVTGVFPPGVQPPHARCHASTIVETDDGGVIAAWFGGSREGGPDVAIWMSRRAAGEAAWGTPWVVAKVEESAHWNPVLYRMDVPDHRGVRHETVFLQFKVGNRIESWRSFVMASIDGFRTVSEEPRELVAGDEGGRGCVKNKPLVLPDQTIICGSSIENYQPIPRWRAFFDRSVDHGRTWHRSPIIDSQPDNKAPFKNGLIQPTLWHSDDRGRHVHAFLRTGRGAVYRVDSSDGGVTWGIAKRTQIPNNNSGIDVVRLRDGTLVLAHNPISSIDAHPSERYPVRVAVSQDNGLTWPNYIDLEPEKGEFSYPAVIPWGAHRSLGFALTYTQKKANIAYLSLAMEDFYRLCVNAPTGNVYDAEL